MTPALPEVAPLGDRAFVIRLGDRISDALFARVQDVARRLEHAHPAICDVVPAFGTVTVHYEPAVLRGNGSELPYATLARIIGARLAALDPTPPPEARTVEIPTCYEGELAPDLELVASGSALSPEQVVALHSGATYVVQVIGFTPGFPYLAGLDPRLATPRRAEPRTRVPAGSVGIGGEQTGIYPIAIPGGWNIIGATPLVVFDPLRTPAPMLRIGDRVRFIAISRARYDALAGR